MNSPKIVGTIRADIGLEEGMRILQCGGSAIDAVEKSIRIVEDNEKDWTVGYGGLPNLIGEVELDASIMDGVSLKAGAVAGIKYYKNPISIARKVMEETPHVFLVGEGANQFAEISGFTKTELLTQSSKDLHREFLEGKGIVKHDYDDKDTLKLKERYLKSFDNMVKNQDLMKWYEKYAKENHGTVNVIAMDNKGNICSGVSTSGLSFKLPGRTGDSAIIGAGNYADNRYGAAACVGVGEIAIRLSIARITVLMMSQGKTVEEAAVSSIELIKDLEKNVGSLAVLAMDAKGNVCSASNFKGYHFWMSDNESPKPRRCNCIYVDTSQQELGVGYHR
ncbi:MAG: N(4)-(beta-N-acetylglucosaminyl)-L-asparaginase [Candidatus Hodarchaeales archaeon]